MIEREIHEDEYQKELKRKTNCVFLQMAVIMNQGGGKFACKKEKCQMWDINRGVCGLCSRGEAIRHITGQLYG